MPEFDAGTGGAGEITRLLSLVRDGDRDALGKLLPLVYADLRSMAHRQLAAARPGETLNTTALVHDAYLKLAGSGSPGWVDRRHFFGVAARAMRQIIVDYARARAAQKRGGGAAAVPIDEGMLPGLARSDDVLALDEALARLETANERPARVVELRFFAGLSIEETAEAMNVSPRTVKREWRFARAFLFDALSARGG